VGTVSQKETAKHPDWPDIFAETVRWFNTHLEAAPERRASSGSTEFAWFHSNRASPL
jgi:hypothetical protein